MNLPYVSYDAARLLYDISEAAILDDRHDLGWFTYKNRKNHKYHGKVAKDHPDPFHHWQWGGLGIAIAEVMGLLATLNEAQQALNQDKKEQT